ncbi:MAG: class I SAM-dependent methyltransferase [Sphingobium sp.]
MTAQPLGAGGYVTDLAYPGLFHRETSPVWIAAILAATGQRAPALDRPFRYLDLGCGPGLNVALLAAANPHGEFVGVDINPRHVEQGRKLAALLPNLRFEEAGFDRLAQGDPFDAPFDFIVAHGVYSWVAAERRADMHEIVRRWLAPGGLLYLHYTSHPGHSAFAGAQAMLRRIADRTPGDSAAKLANGLACIRALEAGGAGYLHAHPAVGRILLRPGEDAAYLAHDLLAADWTALHSGDVIEQLEAVGCAFVASAALLDNIDALSVPGAALPVIGRIGDVKARETARDLARNQSVRRDLYRRGLAGLTPDAYHAQLEGLRYRALPGMRAGGDLTVEMTIGPVSVDAAMVDPLRALLRRGEARFGDMLRGHPSGVTPGFLIRAVLMLMAAGEIHAAHPEGQAGGETLRAFNRKMAPSGWLAAPAIGSAVALDHAERAVATALLDDPGLGGKALLRVLPTFDAEEVARVERASIPVWRSLAILPA